MYAVILAGGGGTRLWPLSTPERPKPFLPLIGERSLLQATVDRLIGPELQLEPADVTVVTDRRYRALVAEQLPDVAIIAEPAGRNTAAAIALAAVAIDRDPDEVMIVLPADHRIANAAAERRVLAVAARLAEGAFGVDEPLVTLGIRPTRAATDYGYLLPESDRRMAVDGIDTAVLRAFEEKPGDERATELLLKEEAAWNAGIFVWRRRSIRDALERYTGLITLLEPVLGRETGLADAYDRVLPLSIDRAVMEGAAGDGRVVMASLDVGWSDLGSWTALLEVIGATGTGRVIQPEQRSDAGADDLVIERVGRRLTVWPGPRGILASTPVALLAGAAGDRPRVEALVRRISAWEETA